MNNITRTSTTELIMELTKRIESAKAYDEQTGREQALEAEVVELTKQVKELESKVQGQYDDIVMLEREVEVYTKKYNELVKQKEASSGPCGCQAYRDLEEKVATMPVIPKAVAIAIFREGTLFGVEAVCDEIQGETINIEESEYVHNKRLTSTTSSTSTGCVARLVTTTKTTSLPTSKGCVPRTTSSAVSTGLTTKNHEHIQIHSLLPQGQG
jgi:hypothetical protein